MNKSDQFEHGTYAGWNAHKKLDEAPCIACRKAASEYQAQWRKQNPKGYKRELHGMAAADRARRRLARAHPEEYRQLYLEEKGKA